MINYYKRTIRDNSIKEIPDIAVGCWINVVNPLPEEIDYLEKRLNLNKKNLESGLDQNEIPHLDFNGNDIYFFVKNVPNIKKEEVETFLIVVSNDFILTLSKTKSYFIENILKNKVNFITTQKLKCLIKILFFINEGFEKLTMNVVKKVQASKELTKDLQEKELNNLLKQESILNTLVSSYYYMNLLYQKTIRRVEFFEQDKEILEDLIVEATQGLNLCKSSLKSISNMRDYYVILLSNRLNRIMTIFTVFTILISIPAAISGIYGMNIKLPFADEPAIFSYIILLILGIWVVFIVYLKKRRII